MRNTSLLLLGSNSAVLVSALLMGGCSFDLNLDGDQTPGDEGRSNWQIDDGLCPGFGGCNLDALLANGATTTLDVEVDGRSPTDIEITAVGPATIGEVVSRDESAERIRVRMTATGPGIVTLGVSEIGGEEIDRTRLTVAEPTDMACGLIPPSGSVHYTLENLLPDHEVTLAVPTAEETVTRQAACRIDDATGTPLLSVALVTWEITEGEGIVRVDAEPGEVDPNSSAGARVSLTPIAAGTATVVARFGDMDDTFTVTVE